jgi:predicted AAA+ superfamily ATPase
MKRAILDRLKAWKERVGRKPLLLQGARQVGKTFILKEFGRTCFGRVHYVNFEEMARFVSVFSGDLSPTGVIRDVSLMLEAPINRHTDLLVLDEIQQCPRALTSLKYFSEEMPELAVCAAGSLLGVHLGECSFPVGKVDELHMFPLTFEEFLLAGESPILQNAFAGITELAPLSPALHQRLWDEFKLYLVTGGLPEVVAAFLMKREDPYAAFQDVRSIQTRLISDYIADMAKHCGKQNAMHLERLWRSVPAQIGRDQSGAAQKFVFKDVLPGIKGYERMAGVIDWLEASGLVIRLPIANCGQLPFSAYTKENAFKLFVFDVGILGALSRLPAKALLDYDFGTYKGYYAENVVAQTFRAGNRTNLACWREGTAEVEFITDVDGAVVPVEVKSGWVTQAKSLRSFADKYKPAFSAVFSGRNAGSDRSLARHYYPLYLASKFPLPVAAQTESRAFS